MSSSFLDLQQGFDGQPVEVRLNGRLLWRGRPYSDPDRGLAERLELDVPPEGGVLTVALLHRRASVERRMAPGAVEYLGMSLVPEGLRSRRSRLPFVYPAEPPPLPVRTR